MYIYILYCIVLGREYGILFRGTLSVSLLFFVVFYETTTFQFEFVDL